MRFHMDSKIPILFVIVQMGMGGAERLVYNLCSKLDRSLFRPSVAWFYGEKALKEFVDLDIPLHFIPKRRRFDPETIVQFARLVKNLQIKVVNAHHFMSYVYLFPGAKILNNTKLIYTEHSSWELDRLPKRWRLVGKRMFGKLDHFVGVSNEVSRTAEDIFGADPGKYVTILNGVDLSLFENSAAREVCRERIGINHGDIVIGNVANFRKVKNHLHLIKAFQALSENHRNVKLLLVGKGFEDDPENTESEVRRYISEHRLDRTIICLGYRSDIPDLMGCMDIFCLTSRMEGLPISLIEAMAAGLPIVGTDVDGIRSVVQNGVNGFLVPPEDVGVLEHQFQMLVENQNLRTIMGQAGKNLAKSLYSLDSCVLNYQRLYSDTVGIKN